MGFDFDVLDIPNASNSLIGNGETSLDIKTSTSDDTYGTFLLGLNLNVVSPYVKIIKSVEDGDVTDLVSGSTIGNNTSQPLKYILTIDNIGDAVAENVVAVGIIPTELTIDETSLPASATYNSTTRELKYEYSSISNSDAAFDVSFKAVVEERCSNYDIVVDFTVSYENAIYGVDKDDSPTFIASSGGSCGSTQASSLKLTYANGCPTASDDSFTVDEDSSNNLFPVLTSGTADDFGVDGASSSAITITSAPSHGTAIVNDSGTLNDPTDDRIGYSPNTNYNGSDSFKYQICDADGDCSTATVSITVTAMDDAPVISATDKTLPEGTTFVETVTATDADAGDIKTFSITGGADAALFAIDPATGELSFKTAPDYENPTDAGANNVYDVEVTVTDGASHTDSKIIAVTITGINDNNPVITATDKTLSEGTTTVETVTATDADAGDTKTFSITGGADAALFEINPATGELSFKTAPDYENPTDAGANNVYDLEVTVTDGASHTDSKTIAVTVTGINDNSPVITATDKTLSEGTTIVETVTATDADAGDIKTFSITGGADAALFEIDPATGELSFKTAPDFENPTDNGGDNVYDVTVTVTDGASHTDSKTIAVTVTGINDNNPVISATDKTLPEGTTTVETVTATDADAGDTKTFSITGGADAALFEIDPATGELSFKTAPDFENPTDNGGDNVYDVTVTVTDAASHNDSETIAVTITGINDNSPVITATDKTLPEGTTTVETVTATDADAGDTKTFSITGGADAALFGIDAATGELTFKTAPDYENPTDAGGNNVYDVEVTVTDGASHTDSKTIAVIITGINDNSPVIAATDKTLPEGTTTVETVTATDADAGDTKTFSITGGADAALFEIDPATGELSFKTAPDFENPTDNGGDNVYDVTVTVTDGASHTDSKTIAVTVTGINDNTPAISATDKTLPEGTTTVETVTATDADAGDSKTFSITGGADAALFEIDAATGELTFKTAPDYENPTDAGANNVYDVEVTVTDGANHTDSEEIAVTITGVNDNSPEAINDVAKIEEDGTLSSESILLNDSDLDGDELKVNTIPVVDVAHGELTIHSDGTYTYTPDANFHGTDRFTYEVCDDGTPQQCSQATVTITVDAANDGPVAIDDSAEIDEDGRLNGPNLLGNDSDPDGDKITVNITPVADVAHGQLTIHADGTYTYLPDADFQGTDSFTYEVCDNGTPQLCSQATVIITVDPVNDAPVATDDSAQVDEDGTLNGTNLLGNDSDPDGDDLTVNTTPVVDVAHGELTIHSDGTYTYIPDVDFNGTDSFTYEVCDNGTPQQCSQATVTITVAEQNDRPYGEDKVISIQQDAKNEELEIANPIDPDGDEMFIEITELPEYGVIFLSNGMKLQQGSRISVEELILLKYDAPSEFVGDCSFRYKIFDPEGLFGEAMVTIQIEPIDVFIPDAFTPNSDSFNDQFEIVGIGNYPDNKLQIFNRWGNMVFEMSGYDNSWNGYGNVSGQISKDRLPTGTYYYILHLKRGMKARTGYIYMIY
ncbi:MAG: Ig-like domain-containing protein [Marinifilaceae bacterium]